MSVFIVKADIDCKQQGTNQDKPMQPIAMQITREPGNDDIELPAYKSEAASGMDVRAANAEPLTLPPGGIKLIPTALRVAVPTGFEVQVRPRSGLALKNGIIVVNSPGTIDADYRGPVGIILGNLGTAPFVINRGDRIAQLVIQKVEHVKVELVDALDDTVRGEGGFGSSGVS